MTADRAQVYVGGRVLPLDGKSAPSAALVVRNGVVVGSGSREDMRALAGADAQVIDIGGQVLMPGLVDTHLACP